MLLSTAQRLASWQPGRLPTKAPNAALLHVIIMCTNNVRACAPTTLNGTGRLRTQQNTREAICFQKRSSWQLDRQQKSRNQAAALARQPIAIVCLWRPSKQQPGHTLCTSVQCDRSRIIANIRVINLNCKRTKTGCRILAERLRRQRSLGARNPLALGWAGLHCAALLGRCNTIRAHL